MNLHAIVAGAVGAVNPLIPVTVRVSTGYTTQADGTRVPTYDDVAGLLGQIQPLQYTDIQMMDGLQLNGERRAVYLNGRYDSLNRASGTGGDLVVFPDGAAWPYGTTWLVAVTAEQWPDWVKLLCTLQNNG